MKKILMPAVVLICALLSLLPLGAAEKDSFIKYVEFNVTYKALTEAMEVDLETHGTDTPISWIDLLSLLGARYGGNFDNYKTMHLKAYEERLKSGESIEEISKDMEYFSYYKEAYSAVLSGLVGEYTEYTQGDDGTVTEEKNYGLKAYSPIASSFPYSHYDDFGASRSYGYQRPHLGHDLMAAVGTPVVAVEDGVVECLGWNQYGGWRIGIRSKDKKRYYYYAHLRQNRPYHASIEEGAEVKAGQVIGYVGRTGYSANENVNGIDEYHLHLGLELIFDESQKESDNEIWVDLYALTQLLSHHKSRVYRVAETKEFYSLNQELQEENTISQTETLAGDSGSQ
ncbi:MAG: M23 family metallopeptidase [Ruminococcus sp.]